jgi:hypothetical protein
MCSSSVSTNFTTSPSNTCLYFNKARHHQGVGQRIPEGQANDNPHGNIVAIPVLGGLHHDYRRAA